MFEYSVNVCPLLHTGDGIFICEIASVLLIHLLALAGLSFVLKEYVKSQ